MTLQEARIYKPVSEAAFKVRRARCLGVPVHNVVIRVAAVASQNNQETRHALEPEGCPQIAEHSACITMSSVEYGNIDRIRNVGRHIQTINASRGVLDVLGANIALVCLRDPNGQRHLVNVIAWHGALESTLELALRPDEGPVQQALVDALPCGRLRTLLG